ncbi:protein of unknown function [Burkholderia multivorans]
MLNSLVASGIALPKRFDLSLHAFTHFAFYVLLMVRRSMCVSLPLAIDLSIAGAVGARILSGH